MAHTYTHPLHLKRPLRPKPFAVRKLLMLLAAFCACTAASAQAPTSLQYPTPSVFIANANTVYMAPTVAGVPTSYSVSPSLPAGLSLNTTTGVISGSPTSASAAATYTVTATNVSGSATKAVSIAVTNSFFNNSYGQVTFKTALGSTDTLRIIGNGQTAGDITLYRNVATLSSQAIDCIVKTVSVTNVTAWDAYDQVAVTDGSTFNSNDENFFSPQIQFGTGGGDIVFEFQFILGGSFSTATNTGTNVTLQNVLLNTYDIDGNGTALSNQFNRFDGFSSSEVSSTTTLNAATYDATTGLTQFQSSISTNNLTVTSDATRVKLTYNNMSNFRIQVGAGEVGRAYFFLDFSSGPGFFTTVTSTPPTIDLNTSLSGTLNSANGCASALAFTASGQTNAASGTVLNELTVSYDNTVANLPDGANEQLLINGSTGGTGTHALNFSTGSSSSVTVGGVAYTITKSVSGTTNYITFATGTTFTLSDAETLLDALRYSNAGASPSNGDRAFTVNIRNTQFKSPDAVFTASLNCVSLAGNIYHDVNGLSDATVNGSAVGTTGTITGQFAASGAYAVLTNPSTNAVLATVAISAGGAYSFGRQSPGDYSIFISNTATPGATVTTATYPAGGYKSIGENLGASSGTDGTADGKLRIVLGSVAVTNANFGVQIPPAASNYTFGNQPNPGGFNYYAIPTTGSTGFVASDGDGSLQSIIITAFPTGANYLKIGSTIYTNGGTCPPQSSCTAWASAVTVPWANVNTIAVDPTSASNTTVTVDYKVVDNGLLESNNGVVRTVTIPFTVPGSPLSVTGNVWVDANADGTKAAGEAYSAAATSGQTLYAVLIQKTNTYSGANTIYDAVAVTAAATGYTFADVPSGNDYEVRIVSLATIPGDGVAAGSITPSLATGYTGVSTNNGGTITANQNTNDLVNALGVVSVNKTGINFGIEQAPVGANYTAARQANPGGSGSAATVPVAARSPYRHRCGRRRLYCRA